MFNPFMPFEEEYLAQLQKLNKHLLVSQDAVVPGTEKTAILFTDYDHPGHAEMHFKAIRNHKYAAIIDLKNPLHLERIKNALKSPCYELWWSVVRDREGLKKTISKKYKENIRRYIYRNTDWKISGDKSVETVLQVIFGQFYLSLKWGNQTIRIKFEEIESS
jgi:hypothetical protein